MGSEVKVENFLEKPNYPIDLGYIKGQEYAKRALEIADSPNVGMCLCVGCWLEGGPLMGKDVIETILFFKTIITYNEDLYLVDYKDVPGNISAGALSSIFSIIKNDEEKVETPKKKK
jgi:hypothetical protein